MASGGAPAIELIGIDKRFGPVRANRDVSLTVADGTVHGIVGENGAGKSTLMGILYGFYEADAGEIRVAGRPVAIRSAADAIAAGIGMDVTGVQAADLGPAASRPIDSRKRRRFMDAGGSVAEAGAVTGVRAV